MIVNDARHDAIKRMIQQYKSDYPLIANENKWSDHPRHISHLLYEIHAYCDIEGIDFADCLFKADKLGPIKANLGQSGTIRLNPDQFGSSRATGY